MTETDVLVVGAGPTGLVTACALRAGGAGVDVVDAATERSRTSRAAVVHARTLEVLEPLGVTERLRADGLQVGVFTLRQGRRTLVRLDFAGLPTRYPFTLMVPQWRTEERLEQRLVELGGAVERGLTVVDVTPDGERVRVRLRDAAGAEHLRRPRWVVGADGTHSRVRTSTGTGFPGAAYAQDFVLADVRLDWPLPPAEVQLFTGAGGLLVVAPLPGGHHRVVATLDGAGAAPTARDVAALLDARGPGGAAVRELAWSSRFRVHHRLAERLRTGRVLLVGDAAHVHSPAGGQGMNTGIQDGTDLGATLADVLAGRAPDGALDAWAARRLAVAREVVRLTDRATRMATLRPGPARAGRNAALTVLGRVPAVRRAAATRLAELVPTAAGSR